MPFHVSEHLEYCQMKRPLEKSLNTTLINTILVTRIIDGVSTFHADFKSALTFFLTRQVSE